MSARLYHSLAVLLERLDADDVLNEHTMTTCAPVLFFGRATTARVATVGLNPSNREFVHAGGEELEGLDRRFPTLRSLGRSAWADVDASQLLQILASSTQYFERNPYDLWFRALERLLGMGGHSFYGAAASVCHLDLVPYATPVKWGELPASDQRALLLSCADSLGRILEGTEIATLILNGQGVVRRFEAITDTKLHATRMPEWSLARAGGPSTVGIGYQGEVESVGGVPLQRAVQVLGYNHNLQSSFGVTTAVLMRIGDWLNERMANP